MPQTSTVLHHIIFVIYYSCFITLWLSQLFLESCLSPLPVAGWMVVVRHGSLSHHLCRIYFSSRSLYLATSGPYTCETDSSRPALQQDRTEWGWQEAPWWTPTPRLWPQLLQSENLTKCTLWPMYCNSCRICVLWAEIESWQNAFIVRRP